MRHYCKNLLIGIATLYLIGVITPLFAFMSEADYRQEIREQFSLQCLVTLQRRLGVANPMTVEKALLLLELRLPPDVKMEEDRILNVVRDQSTGFRQRVYTNAVEACVNSGIAASNMQ